MLRSSASFTCMIRSRYHGMVVAWFCKPLPLFDDINTQFMSRELDDEAIPDEGRDPRATTNCALDKLNGYFELYCTSVTLCLCLKLARQTLWKLKTRSVAVCILGNQFWRDMPKVSNPWIAQPSTDVHRRPQEPSVLSRPPISSPSKLLASCYIANANSTTTHCGSFFKQRPGAVQLVSLNWRVSKSHNFQRCTNASTSAHTSTSRMLLS
nr:hypothetical protein CFP56_63467 [Quercus suber]